jgi:hypothetical protein
MALPVEPFLVEPDGMIAESLFARLHPHVKVLGQRRKQLLRYNLALPVQARSGGAVALIRTREQFCQIVDKNKFPGGYEHSNQLMLHSWPAANQFRVTINSLPSKLLLLAGS